MFQPRSRRSATLIPDIYGSGSRILSCNPLTMQGVGSFWPLFCIVLWSYCPSQDASGMGNHAGFFLGGLGRPRRPTLPFASTPAMPLSHAPGIDRRREEGNRRLSTIRGRRGYPRLQLGAPGRSYGSHGHGEWAPDAPCLASTSGVGRRAKPFQLSAATNASQCYSSAHPQPHHVLARPSRTQHRARAGPATAAGGYRRRRKAGMSRSDKSSC